MTQDKSQWTQIGKRESSVWRQKDTSYWEGGHTLEQVARGGCRVSICEDIQNLTGDGSARLALAGCLSRGVGLDDLKRSLLISTIQWFCQFSRFHIILWWMLCQNQIVFVTVLGAHLCVHYFWIWAPFLKRELKIHSFTWKLPSYNSVVINVIATFFESTQTAIIFPMKSFLYNR